MNGNNDSTKKIEVESGKTPTPYSISDRKKLFTEIDNIARCNF